MLDSKIKRSNKYLTNLFFSVHTVNYGQCFFPSFYGPKTPILNSIHVPYSKRLDWPAVLTKGKHPYKSCYAKWRSISYDVKKYLVKPLPMAASLQRGFLSWSVRKKSVPSSVKPGTKAGCGGVKYSLTACWWRKASKKKILSFIHSLEEEKRNSKWALSLIFSVSSAQTLLSVNCSCVFTGRKRRGVRPSHFERSSSSVARNILKGLEQLKLVEKDNSGWVNLTFDRVLKLYLQGTKKFNFPACQNFLKKKIPQTFTCPSRKLRVKSSSTGLLDSNFFVPWFVLTLPKAWHNSVVSVVFNWMGTHKKYSF